MRHKSKNPKPDIVIDPVDLADVSGFYFDSDTDPIGSDTAVADQGNLVTSRKRARQVDAAGYNPAAGSNLDPHAGSKPTVAHETNLITYQRRKKRARRAEPASAVTQRKTRGLTSDKEILKVQETTVRLEEAKKVVDKAIDDATRADVQHSGQRETFLKDASRSSWEVQQMTSRFQKLIAHLREFQRDSPALKEEYPHVDGCVDRLIVTSLAAISNSNVRLSLIEDAKFVSSTFPESMQ